MICKRTEWPEVLCSASEIADYVVELSPYDVCGEAVEEQFFGCQAKLVWVDLSSLQIASSDHHVMDEDRQFSCDNKDVSTMPPLLVAENTLVDGYHRLRTLHSKNITHHWAYVIEDIPEVTCEYDTPLARKESRWDIGMEP